MSELSIEELQIKIAFLERHIEQQDRVIYELRNDMDRLKDTVRKLSEKSDSNSGGQEGLPADEKPPHY